jgi:peptide/nickel transport system substrate-binding protein
MELTRRRAITLAGATALGGCGESGRRPLTAAVLTMPASLGNPFTSNTTPSTTIWYALFDGLTRIDENGQIMPGLATAWRQRSPTAWEFALRRDVRFSNGKPFDAAAVVAVTEWLASDAGRTTFVANDFGPGLAAAAVDPFTVVLTTGRPDAVLPARASWLPIVEPEAWRRLGPEGFAQAPAGTGPYALTTWNDNGRARAVRNPGAWRVPKIEAIEFVAIPDPVARAQALQAGSADVGMIDLDSIARVDRDGVAVVSVTGQQVLCVGFATVGRPRSPFLKREVRLAANYAVDRERIVAEILHGFGKPAGQLAPESAVGYNPEVRAYPYDPDRARALLRDAGYPDGFDIVLTIINDSATTSVFQAVVRDLAAVGIRTTIRVVTFATWTKGYFGGEWNETDAIGASAVSRMNDGLHGISVFGGHREPAFYRDPALVELVREIEAIADPASRAARLRQAAVQVHDAVPAIFLVDFAVQMGFGPRVNPGAVAARVPVYETIAWR